MGQTPRASERAQRENVIARRGGETVSRHVNAKPEQVSKATAIMRRATGR